MSKMNNLSRNFTGDLTSKTNRFSEEIIAEIVVRFGLVFLGTTINALVCLTFWFNPRLVTNSTRFLWNLSVADLVTSLFSIPVSLWASFLQLNDALDVGSPDAGSSIPWSKGAIVATFSASILTLVVMSVDRCLMIRLPIVYRGFITVNKVKLAIFGMWLLSLLNFVLIITRSIPGSVFSKTVFAGLLICYFIITVCYMALFCGIKRQGSATASNEGSSNAHARQQVLERELAKTIAIIIAVFTVSWLPLGYTMLTHSDFEEYANYNAFPHWAATVGMTTAVVHPLIYFARNRDYLEAACTFLRIQP